MADLLAAHIAREESVVLGIVSRTLGGAEGARVSIFLHDPARDVYALSAIGGYPREAAGRLRSEVLFRRGEERGLVGLVAGTAEPIYLRDCASDPRWIGRSPSGSSRSAYFVPIVREGAVVAVICALSPRVGGLGAEVRAHLDWMAAFIGRLCSIEGNLRSRIDRLEREMRNVALGWEELRSWLIAKHSGDLGDRLRGLSPRAWEVVERVSAGQRVATIARELGISPHTVRNHLKVIGRHLGIRSQPELRERIGALRLGKPIGRRPAS